MTRMHNHSKNGVSTQINQFSNADKCFKLLIFISLLQFFQRCRNLNELLKSKVPKLHTFSFNKALDFRKAI